MLKPFQGAPSWFETALPYRRCLCKNISRIPNFEVHILGHRTIENNRESRFTLISVTICSSIWSHIVVRWPNSEIRGNLEIRYAGNVFAWVSSICKYCSKSTWCTLEMFEHLEVGGWIYFQCFSTFFALLIRWFNQSINQSVCLSLIIISHLCSLGTRLMLQFKS